MSQVALCCVLSVLPTADLRRLMESLLSQQEQQTKQMVCASHTEFTAVAQTERFGQVEAALDSHSRSTRTDVKKHINDSTQQIVDSIHQQTKHQDQQHLKQTEHQSKQFEHLRENGA